MMLQARRSASHTRQHRTHDPTAASELDMRQQVHATFGVVFELDRQSDDARWTCGDVRLKKNWRGRGEGQRSELELLD